MMNERSVTCKGKEGSLGRHHRSALFFEEIGGVNEVRRRARRSIEQGAIGSEYTDQDEDEDGLERRQMAGGALASGPLQVSGGGSLPHGEPPVELQDATKLPDPGLPDSAGELRLEVGERFQGHAGLPPSQGRDHDQLGASVRGVSDELDEPHVLEFQHRPGPLPLPAVALPQVQLVPGRGAGLSGGRAPRRLLPGLLLGVASCGRLVPGAPQVGVRQSSALGHKSCSGRLPSGVLPVIATGDGDADHALRRKDAETRVRPRSGPLGC